jgi:hypothetical protein
VRASLTPEQAAMTLRKLASASTIKDVEDVRGEP